MYKGPLEIFWDPQLQSYSSDPILVYCLVMNLSCTIVTCTRINNLEVYEVKRILLNAKNIDRGRNSSCYIALCAKPVGNFTTVIDRQLFGFGNL